MSEHQPAEHYPDPGHERGPQRERHQELHPRIWIGSLADYNNGTLTGAWVDAAVEDEVLDNAAKAVIATSETPDAEEWAIFDYDEFGDWKPDQYELLSSVAQVARGVAEHGAAFAFWADFHGADPDMLASFTDNYQGEWASAADFARELVDEPGIERRVDKTFGDELARYIHFDADAFARDAWLSGDIYVAHKPGGGVWIFTAR